MSRSRVCERLPEHPREQDCVTRPLPSPIFQTRALLRSHNQLSVASGQLPARKTKAGPLRQAQGRLSAPLRSGRDDRPAAGSSDLAKSERRKASSGTSKSLFWKILPITPTGSRFCGDFLTKSLISGRAGRGEGVPVVCQLPASGNRRSLRLLASLVARDDKASKDRLGMTMGHKSLQSKNLLVTLWGSIGCWEKVRNVMILKIREGGGGVIN